MYGDKTMYQGQWRNLEAPK